MDKATAKNKPVLFSTEQLYAMLATLPDPAFVMTRSGRYEAVFGGIDLRYYHDGSSLVGRSVFDVVNAQKARWFCAQIAKALDVGQLHIVEYGLGGTDVDGLAAGPDGEIWFEARIQRLPFQVAEEDAVLWLASNITQRHRLELQLRHASDTDSLTGLYNRRRLIQALHEQFGEYQRHGTATALLLFDIDDFKQINDNHGHLKGDQALQLTGQICRQQLRPSDICARLGGDEFVVLMQHTDIDSATDTAERLRTQISETLHLHLGSGSLSGGLTAFSGADRHFEDTLKRADDALYQAKRRGRDQLVVSR